MGIHWAFLQVMICKEGVVSEDENRMERKWEDVLVPKVLPEWQQSRGGLAHPCRV